MLDLYLHDWNREFQRRLVQELHGLLALGARRRDPMMGVDREDDDPRPVGS